MSILTPCNLTYSAADYPKALEEESSKIKCMHLVHRLMLNTLHISSSCDSRFIKSVEEELFKLSTLPTGFKLLNLIANSEKIIHITKAKDNRIFLNPKNEPILLLRDAFSSKGNDFLPLLVQAYSAHYDPKILKKDPSKIKCSHLIDCMHLVHRFMLNTLHITSSDSRFIKSVEEELFKLSILPTGFKLLNFIAKSGKIVSIEEGDRNQACVNLKNKFTIRFAPNKSSSKVKNLLFLLQDTKTGKLYLAEDRYSLAHELIHVYHGIRDICEYHNANAIKYPGNFYFCDAEEMLTIMGYAVDAHSKVVLRDPICENALRQESGKRCKRIAHYGWHKKEAAFIGVDGEVESQIQQENSNGDDQLCKAIQGIYTTGIKGNHLKIIRLLLSAGCSPECIKNGMEEVLQKKIPLKLKGKILKTFGLDAFHHYFLNANYWRWDAFQHYGGNWKLALTEEKATLRLLTEPTRRNCIAYVEAIYAIDGHKGVKHFLELRDKEGRTALERLEQAKKFFPLSPEVDCLLSYLKELEKTSGHPPTRRKLWSP